MNNNLSHRVHNPLHKDPGVIIGVGIILAWFAMLGINLFFPFHQKDPISYLRMLIQMHLYTGLFITAHDAMHGTVSPKRPRLNHQIGRIAATLFIFNSYGKLRPKHYAHHRHPGTEKDPDYHKGNSNFFRWYIDFLSEYISWKQILFAAITFNVLKLALPTENLVIYWIIPSFLSTFQLFYFGTFLPHMGEHKEENPHRAHSQKKNHPWAFISCYFFGYHFEHHDSPQTPWWRLWKVKEDRLEVNKLDHQ